MRAPYQSDFRASQRPRALGLRIECAETLLVRLFVEQGAGSRDDGLGVFDHGSEVVEHLGHGGAVEGVGPGGLSQGEQVLLDSPTAL